MNEIRRIINEYKEACQEWGISEYKKKQLKMDAFDEIVSEVEYIDKIKARKDNDTLEGK